MATSARPLELTVESGGEEAVVHVSGELDFHSSPRLREEVLKLIGAGVKRLTLDLAGLDFMDSGGLAVLIASVKRLNSEGGGMYLRSVPPRTQNLLEVSGLTTLLPTI